MPDLRRATLLQLGARRVRSTAGDVDPPKSGLTGRRLKQPNHHVAQQANPQHVD
jgi:hypothetical protein